MSLRRFLHRPRYADVAATLALVLATGGGAYAAVATLADPNSVDTAAIQNHAVTAPKLATESVTSDKIAPDSILTGKLAPGAVDGSKVANHSLSLSDLAGTSQSGPISFSIAAHRCGYLTLAVAGARVGQAAVLTWIGTTNPPQGIMVGPLKVVAAGRIVASACDDTGHRITGRNVRARVITLG